MGVDIFPKIIPTAGYKAEIDSREKLIQEQVEKDLQELQTSRLSLVNKKPPFKLPLTKQQEDKYREMQAEVYNLSLSFLTPTQMDYMYTLQTNNMNEFSTWRDNAKTMLNAFTTALEVLLGEELHPELASPWAMFEKKQREHEDGILQDQIDAFCDNAPTVKDLRQQSAQLSAECDTLQKKFTEEQSQLEHRGALLALKATSKLKEEIDKLTEEKDRALANVSALEVEAKEKYDSWKNSNEAALLQQEIEKTSKTESKLNALESEYPKKEEAILAFSNALKDNGFTEIAWDLSQKNGIMVWKGIGKEQMRIPLIDEMENIRNEMESKNPPNWKDILNKILKENVVLAYKESNSEYPMLLTYDASTDKLDVQKYEMPALPEPPKEPVRPEAPPHPEQPQRPENPIYAEVPDEPVPLSGFAKMWNGFLKVFGSSSAASRQYDHDLSEYQAIRDQNATISQKYEQDLSVFENRNQQYQQEVTRYENLSQQYDIDMETYNLASDQYSSKIATYDQDLLRYNSTIQLSTYYCQERTQINPALSAIPTSSIEKERSNYFKNLQEIHGAAKQDSIKARAAYHTAAERESKPITVLADEKIKINPDYDIARSNAENEAEAYIASLKRGNAAKVDSQKKELDSALNEKRKAIEEISNKLALEKETIMASAGTHVQNEMEILAQSRASRQAYMLSNPSPEKDFASKSKDFASKSEENQQQKQEKTDIKKEKASQLG